MSQQSSAWGVLRRHFTRCTRPGTVGYYEGLITASQLAAAMNLYVTDPERLKADMDADGELAHALGSGVGFVLRSIGL